VEPNTPSYPVRVAFDPPERIPRWLPLVVWLLVIPHLLVLWAVGIVAEVCVVIGWFAILFTGELPEGLARFVALMIRYQTRVMTYGMFLQEEYPPFEYPGEGTDPGDYPRVRVEMDPALTDRNRVTVLLRYFLVLPHLFVLIFVGIAAGVAAFIAWFAVIITGQWPAGLRDFVLGYVRWSTRLSGYAYLLTDAYPPFSTR
jgi:Domain of unknown function (DUF4389)